LLEQVGLIEIGPPDGIVVPGVLKAAHAHGLPVEELSASELRGRFPGLRSPEGMMGVFEPTAGFLYVEQCIAAYLQLARQAGAQLRTNVSAECRVDGQGVRIEAGNETFTADRCVVTAGPWAGEVLADLGLALEVVRSPLFWYRCEDPSFSASAGMPCFFYELPHGYFYGFPAIDSAGVKVARHGGGAHVVNPLEVDRALDEREQAEIEEFLGQWLPGVSHECLDHRVCMYTMTSDEHFVVDRHPSHEQIVFAAGLSGHGFKFSCVLGEALSDLALSGNTQLPIDFLSLKRFNS
jgi:monomeric sarcosine oxidase